MIVFTQQTLTDMGICAAIFVAAVIYYAVYLRQWQSTHWVMLAAAPSNEAEATVPEPMVDLDTSPGN